MKFNELKVGDHIKFYIDSIIKEGWILELTDKKVKIHYAITSLSGCFQWIRKEQVISKIEFVPKEIPVEKPPIPVSFTFQPTKYQVTYGTNDGDFGWMYHNGRNTTQIEALALDGTPFYLKLPFSLPMDCNKQHKITIEEIQ